jgi:hypothetical protein
MKITDSNPVQLHIDSLENKLISNLDPLKADDYMGRVPILNKQKDIRELASLAEYMMPSKSEIQVFNYYEANAATRDIGFLLGSLKRHGIEPARKIQDLGEKMNLLSEKTNLPPRDTLLHYTVWNPVGNRRRSYTGTEDENHLIDSVVIAMQPLVNAIHLLKRLHDIPIRSASFKHICDQMAVNFKKVIEGIVVARRKVSPSYFTEELRLYFDPIILNNQKYLGPGAVEMPMFVFDHLLWSSDCDNEEYQVFKETYVPYIHSEMRSIYYQFENRRSLLSKCCSAITNQNTDFDPITFKSLKALRSCFRLLNSFRMPHKKVAEEAYSHLNDPTATEQHVNQAYRNNGSGGYSPTILSHILQLTNQSAAKLDGCIAVYQNRARIV